MDKPKFFANKLQSSALITTTALGIIEIVAHMRQLKIPMLDQAFIAAIGVLFAPAGDKTAEGKKEGDGGKA